MSSGRDSIARRRGSGDELDRAILEQRQAEWVEAFALLAFTADELAAIAPPNRRVLDMLLKRHLNAVPEPTVTDALHIRRQFEDFCDRQQAPASALWIAAALDQRSR